MLHSFNTDVAKECGILAATIFHHIGYWCDYNEKNGFNLHDGKYWTYNSKRAFSEQFYYCSEKQVRTALQALRDAGLIECGSYNKSPYDRTLWYAISDKGQQYNEWSRRKGQDALAPEGQDIGPGGPINWTQGAKTLDPEGQPIPNRKPDRNQTDRKPNDSTDSGASSTTPAKEPKKPKETKEIFGEYRNIKLTPTELQKLRAEYGEIETEDAIRFLDEYIEEKGTKYKSHYLAMRRWVFDAIKERSQRKRKAQGGGYDWDSL